MKPNTANIICYVCQQTVPIEFAHEHHKRPQAVGGGDEDKISLCSGCHANMHQIFYMLMGTKAGSAENVVKSGYSDINAQRRCMELAVEQVKWFQKKKAGQIPIDPGEEVELVIMLSPRIKEALFQEASKIRDIKSGRKIGASRLATQIITDWLCHKYPVLRG